MSIELYTEDRLVYQFYPIVSNQLTFNVKAPNDAHIMLTSTSYGSQPCYEIFFGGWGNTKSVIRKNEKEPDVHQVLTPQILNSNEHRSFWIRWDAGTLTAGIQGDQNPILKYQDQLFPIQYFGVLTIWGATGHWVIERPTTPTIEQAPPPQPGIYPAPPIGIAPPPAAITYSQPGFAPGYPHPAVRI